MPLAGRTTQRLFSVFSTKAATAAIALCLFACDRNVQPPAGDIVDSLAVAQLNAGEGPVVATTLATAFDEKALRGKPAVVVFWQATCPHCLDELPVAEAVAEKTGATMVAVSVSSDRVRAEQALQQIKFHGISLVDAGALRERYGIKQVPYTLVVDSTGRARNVFIGGQDAEVLTSALSALATSK